MQISVTIVTIAGTIKISERCADAAEALAIAKLYEQEALSLAITRAVVTTIS